MAWITPQDVESVYGVEVTEEFIAHYQALAEMCTGDLEEPVSDRVKAVFTEIVFRKHTDLEANPEGTAMETLGPYTVQRASRLGLGLTSQDCRALRRAAGHSSLRVVNLTGGEALETPPPAYDPVWKESL